MRSPARHAGFTLIEVIVVIAIFGIFALMAYGGLDSVLNTRRQVEIAQEKLAAYQKSYIRLRNDLQLISNRSARDGFGDAQPALRGDDKGLLEFTRSGWRNPLSLPRPGFERIAYRYEKGKLIRASWRVLDQAQDSKPVEVTLFDGVEDLRWRYLEKSSSEWRDRWPFEISTGTEQAAARPPAAIELTMRTQELGNLRFVFRIALDPVEIPANGTNGGGTSGVGDVGSPPGDGGSPPNSAPTPNPGEFPE